MSSSLNAATLLPTVLLVQLFIIVNGQYHGAQKQYLLVQVPGELDKISSTLKESYAPCIFQWRLDIIHIWSPDMWSYRLLYMVNTDVVPRGVL